MAENILILCLMFEQDYDSQDVLGILECDVDELLDDLQSSLLADKSVSAIPSGRHSGLDMGLLIPTGQMTMLTSTETTISVIVSKEIERLFARHVENTTDKSLITLWSIKFSDVQLNPKADIALKVVPRQRNSITRSCTPNVQAEELTARRCLTEELSVLAR